MNLSCQHLKRMTKMKTTIPALSVSHAALYPNLYEMASHCQQCQTTKKLKLHFHSQQRLHHQSLNYNHHLYHRQKKHRLASRFYHLFQIVQQQYQSRNKKYLQYRQLDYNYQYYYCLYNLQHLIQHLPGLGKNHYYNQKQGSYDI